MLQVSQRVLSFDVWSYRRMTVPLNFLYPAQPDSEKALCPHHGLRSDRSLEPIVGIIFSLQLLQLEVVLAIDLPKKIKLVDQY